MKITNTPMFSSVDLSTSHNSAAFPIAFMLDGAVQVVITGATPTGTLKLQGSCDPGADSLQAPPPSVINWTDIASSSQSISAAGSVLYTITECGYSWIRLVWTASGGSVGTANARLNSKGF